MKFINGKLDGSSYLYSVKITEVEQMIKDYYQAKYPDCIVDKAKLSYMDSTYDTDGYYLGKVTIKRKMEVLGKEETCKEKFDVREKELSNVFEYHFNKLGLSFEFWFRDTSSSQTICLSCKKLEDNKDKKKKNKKVKETAVEVRKETQKSIETKNEEDIYENSQPIESKIVNLPKEENITIEQEITLEDIIDYLSIIKEYTKRRVNQEIAKKLKKILD